MKHPLDDVLLAALPPHSLYAVGGRVRDEVRRRYECGAVEESDLDYVVVGVPLADVLERLRRVARVDVVGASFAVVKLQAPQGRADVALPRRERSTGVSHRDFAVETGPDIPLVDDLARRDFRMNMMARAIATGELVDPYGGEADIRARRIEILTPQTFADDPLRMLRAAQFAGRFAYALSPSAIRAIRAAASLVTTVSAERVGDELGKLFRKAARPSLGLEVLRATGVLAYLWPELLEGVGMEQNEWHAFDVYRHNLETLDATPPGGLRLRLAGLLHDVGKARTKEGPHFYRHEQIGADLVPPMLARLRLPTALVEDVAHLVRHHMYSADPELEPKALRRFIRRIGVDHLDELFALRAADIAGSGLRKRDGSNEAFEANVQAIVNEKPAFSVRDLAVRGDDIIELLAQAGVGSGDRRGDPRVGEVLRDLFEYVTDDPALNDREMLVAAARRRIAERYGE